MRKIRVQLLALTTLLVVFAVALTIAPTLWIAGQDSDQRVERSLEARGVVFDRLMQGRARQLQKTVRLASEDANFNRAVTAGDKDALPALLAQRGNAAGGELALLLDLDGALVAASMPMDPPRLALPGIVNRAGEKGLRWSALDTNGRLFELITVPLRAPLPVGWLAVGYAVDNRLAENIKSLIDLEATVYRARRDGYEALGSTLNDDALAILVQNLEQVGFKDDDFVTFDLLDNLFMGVKRNLIPDSPELKVLLKESVRDTTATFRQMRMHALGVTVVVTLLAVFLASLIARRVGDPIQELAQAARRIREGDYSAPVVVKSKSELGELAANFNAMQEGIADREERILFQAQFDELTGLPNRLLGLERLAEAIESAGEAGKPVGVLVIDLNSYATIGSSLGHDIGDALLAQAAERLRANLDSRFVLARLEVDTFLAILPGLDGLDARACAEELLRLLTSGLSVRGLNVSIDATIGVSAFPRHGAQADKLLLRATVAKNDARKAEASLRIYEEGREDQHVRHVTILGDLRRAVCEDELKIFMQPKVNLADGSICGAEALVRWDHPTLGFLPPNEFIPLAEESGNISMISKWALTAAIRECRLWQEEGLDLSVSVNLSGRDLQNAELPYLIADVLRNHDLDARKLVLEITEQALVRDTSHARRVLECLRALGTRISIDDFGTGYSSLVQIKNLPVDEVKIDRTFVMELPDDRADVAIVRAAIELAHSLGLDVLAEGVENRATMRWLAAHGCERAQGFLIARPMPAEQFPPWLTAYNEQLEARVESGHAQVDLGFAAGGDRRLRTAG